MIVSTIAELEFMLPTLQEFQQEGRKVNVLYGIPLPKSQVKRLAVLGKRLGEGSITVMVDHIQQLAHVEAFHQEAGFPAGVFLKIDTGYHRAGLPPTHANKDSLIESLVRLDQEGSAMFTGLYSHSSLSYNDSTLKRAMANLESEIKGCLDVLNLHKQFLPSTKPLVISVGASPQVTAIEALASIPMPSPEATQLLNTIDLVQKPRPGQAIRTSLELHAGVYALLDIQQLSTHSRGTQLGSYEEEIAASVLAEVCSVYNDNERSQPEALLAVGALGLGREPSAAYKGWGVVDIRAYAEAVGMSRRRLVIERISQEHAVLVWEKGAGKDGKEETLPPIPLEIGQRVRVYPNHACVAGAMYDRYLVVDSSDESRGTKVVDEWARARGW
jgi:D-serine ammonia-lyase